MRRICFTLLFASFFVSTSSSQDVTGLSGWDIFLDPGHSRTENRGAFGYSEAEKNLEVGLALRELLLSTTDIDTVYMSRWNHSMEVSLRSRVDYANTVGASHFHSIHGNAAAPSVNNIFVLWPQYLDGSEAVPNGGKRMAEIMSPMLSESMRIPDRGAIGECDFYGYDECRGRDLGAGKGGSRNFVQSFTNMASELSEAGYHTNPNQNQRNMNADWKRLEARAMYWTILDYHGLERPPVGILTGIIRDVESGTPINGAVVTVGDTSYVTDTYESLFHLYSDDPDELHNGFYYLDGFQPGASVDVTVEVPGYSSESATVALDESFFTFYDVQLVSQIPPIVESTSPAPGEESFRLIDPIVIDFSRQMDRTSTEAAFSITPEVGGSFTWSNSNTRLSFRPDSLAPETSYQLRIGDSAVGAYGHGFDGDADGTAGGDFVLNFQTSQTDVFAPVITDGFPRPRQRDVPVRPVITYTFDEELDPATVVPERFSLTPSGGGASFPGAVEYNVISERSVITFHPESDLERGVYYSFTIEPGLTDLAGNAIDKSRAIPFETTRAVYEYTYIDPFEPSDDGVWWQPQGSGSTTGIDTDSTAFTTDPEMSVRSAGSTESQKLSYGWDTGAASHLIREYLSGGPARSVFFDTEQIIQVYVYGDGSGNKIRIALDDSQGHEVSPWYTLDWYGWRLIEWDLREGELGTWIGNGALEPPLRMDSFQLTYEAGAAEYGTIWIDEFRLARQVDNTAAEDLELPDDVVLYPNYPNPFNPTTTLRFGLASHAPVTLAIYNALGQQVEMLMSDKVLEAGTHEISWDARDLPSGLYVLRLITPDRQLSRKLILAK